MAATSFEPMIVSRLYAKASKAKIPIGGTFELLPLCNMNCAMCYIKMTKEKQEKKGRLRTKEEWIKLAKEARKEGLLFLLLTGGEPFFWKEFKELYVELHRMGFCLSINTNGTLIDEKTIEWLKEYPPVRMNITLYGASDETYGRLCRNPSGFTQVKKAIDGLKAAGIEVKLNCSLTPYNAADLEEMVAFAEERKLILEIATYMFPPLRKNGKMIGENQRFTPEEAAANVLKANVLQNTEEAFYNYLKYNEFPPMSKHECVETEGDTVWCRAGTSSFWATWDGRLLACGMMEVPQISLEGRSFREAWDYIVEEISKIRLPAKCTGCPAKEQCQTCAAMVMTETGGFDQAPEYRCRMTETYIQKCRELKNGIKKELK